MAEFISSFTSGFSDLVKEDFPKRIPSVKILNLFDGLIHYQFSGNSRELSKIMYFNNTFFILKTWKGKGLNFPMMVGNIQKEKKYYLINKGTFRVRFSKENQFAKVDKNIARRAEEAVVNNSKLNIDRLNPTTEIWYSIRSQDFAFCGQLISKREFTEKNLNKGELRPEVAYFMCLMSDFNQDSLIAEPFAGYGSIPLQLAKKFHFKKLFISDIDQEKIKMLEDKKNLKDRDDIEISVQNAFELKNIEDKSLDLVITDPPWGFYEDIGDISDFYDKCFNSFKRILKEQGRIVMLSARKEELENLLEVRKDFNLIKSFHTLVNGKKAGLYLIEKTE
ncbi:MAG: methyltransferase [Treponema sp.]|nr:methyltransferase [Treponema sp.]